MCSVRSSLHTKQNTSVVGWGLLSSLSGFRSPWQRHFHFKRQWIQGPGKGLSTSLKLFAQLWFLFYKSSGQCWKLFAEGARKGDEERLGVDLSRCCLLEKFTCTGQGFPWFQGTENPGSSPELTGGRLGSCSCIFVPLPGIHGAEPLLRMGPSEEAEEDQLYIGWNQPRPTFSACNLQCMMRKWTSIATEMWKDRRPIFSAVWGLAMCLWSVCESGHFALPEDCFPQSTVNNAKGDQVPCLSGTASMCTAVWAGARGREFCAREGHTKGQEGIGRTVEDWRQWSDIMKQDEHCLRSGLTAGFV